MQPPASAHSKADERTGRAEAIVENEAVDSFGHVLIAAIGYIHISYTLIIGDLLHFI